MLSPRPSSLCSKRKLPGSPSMVWFFARDEELLRIEATHETSGPFVLTIYGKEGQTQRETFGSEAACHLRLEQLEQRLRAEAWTLRIVTPLRPR